MRRPGPSRVRPGSYVTCRPRSRGPWCPRNHPTAVSRSDRKFRITEMTTPLPMLFSSSNPISTRSVIRLCPSVLLSLCLIYFFFYHQQVAHACPLERRSRTLGDGLRLGPTSDWKLWRVGTKAVRQANAGAGRDVGRALGLDKEPRASSTIQAQNNLVDELRSTGAHTRRTGITLPGNVFRSASQAICLLRSVCEELLKNVGAQRWRCATTFFNRTVL